MTLSILHAATSKLKETQTFVQLLVSKEFWWESFDSGAKNFYERCLEYCRALRGASIYLHIFSIFLMVSGISGFIRPSDLNIRSMWYLQTLVTFIFTLLWESLNTINYTTSSANGLTNQTNPPHPWPSVLLNARPRSQTRTRAAPFLREHTFPRNRRGPESVPCGGRVAPSID